MEFSNPIVHHIGEQPALQPDQEYVKISDTLLINPDASASARVLGRELFSTSAEEKLWSIRLVVQCREAIDARLEPANGEIWEFEVKTNIHDKVNLTFAGIETVPRELEVWLTDDALRITQDLRESNVYNLLGEEVVAVVNGEDKPAGYHGAIWDGRDKNGRHVASGVYVYRIRAGSFAKTSKMALVK